MTSVSLLYQRAAVIGEHFGVGELFGLYVTFFLPRAIILPDIRSTATV
jgi:hypothetical protein